MWLRSNMDENNEKRPQEEDLPQEEEKPVKSAWQAKKESWYDKLPVTLKQMDIIVTLCWIAIGLLVVAIALDALDIWSPFS